MGNRLPHQFIDYVHCFHSMGWHHEPETNTLPVIHSKLELVLLSFPSDFTFIYFFNVFYILYVHISFQFRHK